MNRGQAATMSLVAVGSMLIGAFSIWDGWLSNVVFIDHGDLSKVTESVSNLNKNFEQYQGDSKDFQATVNAKLDALTQRQLGYRISPISSVSSTTSNE